MASWITAADLAAVDSQSQDLREKREQTSVEMAVPTDKFVTHAQFAKILEADIAKWARIVKASVAKVN